MPSLRVVVFVHRRLILYNMKVNVTQVYMRLLCIQWSRRVDSKCFLDHIVKVDDLLACLIECGILEEEYKLL